MHATCSERLACHETYSRLYARPDNGASKLIAGGSFVTGILEKVGLPPALSYMVHIGEVLAPLLMLVGLDTRVAALIAVINMIVAFLLAHTRQFFSRNETGGWALELQGLYLGSALVMALPGAGRHSVGGVAGRFN